jgi:predicted acyl esterase
LKIYWDIGIPADDGVVLRADVFHPPSEGRFPAILSYGPYGKGLAFQEGNAHAWERLTKAYPSLLEGSSNKYQNWEVVDPERWVPDGYAVVRVDSRGMGRSPGFFDPWSPRETNDLYECIEWAAAQPWCSGKVGLNGISYYAMNAWQVASLQPPHLAAICAWEGSGDYYREASRHGGILNQMLVEWWYPRSILRVQHGLGAKGLRSAATGELVSGPETLPEEVLAQNRIDLRAWMLEHRLDDEAHRGRSPQWEAITVPFLSAANWGGHGLHARGNFEAYVNAASTQKWLEVHGGAHWEHFYTKYGEELQKRFFGHFLKGEDNGWAQQPRVLLQVRHVDRFVERAENEWPLARTQWTKFYLHPGDCSLRAAAPSEPAMIEYSALGDGIMFLTPPLGEEMEITGPVAAKLFVSSETRDADLFLVLRVFTPDGREIVFQGANDPNSPVALGWLRASHRKLDRQRSLEYRPFHTHDEVRPLDRGQVVELDIEIWPTSIVVPRGSRIGLSVRGKDYEYAGPPISMPRFAYPFRGVGPFMHNDPDDRPPEIFGGKVTLHFGRSCTPYLLLPVIPRASSVAASVV